MSDLSAAMDRDALLALVERVEKATRPDRDIDREIGPLVGIRVVNEGHPLGVCYYDGKGYSVLLPSFTRSIDAALKLVPEGLYPTIDFVTKRVWLRDERGFDVDWGVAFGFASTVATSICAAALRAHANQWADRAANTKLRWIAPCRKELERDSDYPAEKGEAV